MNDKFIDNSDKTCFVHFSNNRKVYCMVLEESDTWLCPQHFSWDLANGNKRKIVTKSSSELMLAVIP